MIEIHCRGNRHSVRVEGGLCPQCRSLLDHFNLRVDVCPFMETKAFRANCQVHRYKKDRRE